MNHAGPASVGTSRRALVRPEPDPRRIPRLRHRILALADLERAGRRHLPKAIFGYIAGSAETGASVRANRAAFDRWSFRPRVLVDSSARSLETELLGERYAAPFGIAPMGVAGVAAFQGDLALATAAHRADIPFLLSAASIVRLEQVKAAAPSAWFQANIPPDRDQSAALLDRLAAAGFGKLVVTVDVPVPANRENNARNGFAVPLRPSLRLAWDGALHPRWLVGTACRTLLRHGMPHFENLSAQRGAPVLTTDIVQHHSRRDALSWADLKWIREYWTGQLVIKGILTAADAIIARDHGADGVIVSNHGGRQLDGAVAPLVVLPDIVAAVGNDFPVMIDGGVWRGTDVIKALALGARFVFLGRAFLYAAAVAGEDGVRHAIRLLAEEVHRNLALLGCPGTDMLNSSYLLEQPGCARM